MTFGKHETGKPPFTTRDATTADHDTLTTILTNAHWDTPLARWLFPDPASRSDLLRVRCATLIAAVRRNDGTMRVACGNGRIVAVALWQPCFADMAHPAFDPSVTPATGAMVRARRLGDELAAAHPSTAHLHLLDIGVPPAWQHRGLGRALLADPDAHLVPIPIYTEASGNDRADWLRRHGYRDYHCTPILLERSSTPIWPLWRSADTRAGEGPA